MLLRYILRSLLFLLLLLALQTAYYHVFSESFPKLDDLNSYLKEGADIIYFDASVNEFIAPGDTDRRQLCTMMQDAKPKLKVRPVTHPAYGLAMYEAYCHYLLKQKSRPRLIIIPLELRYFSKTWYMRPEYQFSHDKAILKGGMEAVWYHPFRIFQFKKDISQAAFEALPIYNADKYVGTIKQCMDTSQGKRLSVIAGYMMSLTIEDTNIQCLKRIVKLMKGSDIKVLFSIHAINYEDGEKYLPGSFKIRTLENVTVLKQVLDKEGADYIDLSFAFGSNVFFWRDYMNEHLRQNGRNYVASRLVSRADSMLRAK